MSEPPTAVANAADQFTVTNLRTSSVVEVSACSYGALSVVCTMEQPFEPGTMYSVRSLR